MHYTIDVIPVVIKLHNTCSEAVSIRTPFNKHQGIEVGFRRPGSDPNVRYKLATLSFLHLNFSNDNPPTVIPPQGAIRHLAFLSPSFLGIDFKLPDPGTLRMKCRYTGETEDGQKLRIESKVTGVSLRSSATLPDTVQKLFGTAAWHRFVIEDGLVSEETVRLFREFHSKGEACPQGNLLSFTVGRSLQRNICKPSSKVDPKTGRVLPEKTSDRAHYLRAAISAYNKALQSKSSDLRAQTLTHLAECYLRIEDKWAALDALKQIQGLEYDVALNERHNWLRKQLQ